VIHRLPIPTPFRVGRGNFERRKRSRQLLGSEPGAGRLPVLGRELEISLVRRLRAARVVVRLLDGEAVLDLLPGEGRRDGCSRQCAGRIRGHRCRTAVVADQTAFHRPGIEKCPDEFEYTLRGSIGKIAKARSCRLGRGLGAGQRHRKDRQETCEIPLASTVKNRPGRERRLTKCSGPNERPPRPLGAPWRPRTQEVRVGPVTETIRDQARASGKS